MNKNNFRQQLRDEQNRCPVIKTAMEKIEQGAEITAGRLRVLRVQTQLRIEDGVLTSLIA